MRRTIAAFAFSASARSGGVPGVAAMASRRRANCSPCLTSSLVELACEELRVAERRRDRPARLGDRIEPRLHVVGALSAGLQRVDAHHLVLGQADGQRLLGIPALEVALGGGRRHEAVLLFRARQEIRDRRQRPLGNGRPHLRDDLWRSRGKLGPRVLRRLHGDVVFAPRTPARACAWPCARRAWPPPGASRS